MKGSGKLAWLVILILVMPFAVYAAGNFIPQYDGYIVTSGSMEPEIQTGSLLYTYKTSAENINVGDTITYQDGDHLTTHKVIEKIGGDPVSFRTKGIANNSPDPGQVTEGQVQGKKLFSIPFLGYIAAWAGSIMGFIALVVLPGLVLILMEVKSILKELSKERSMGTVREN